MTRRAGYLSGLVVAVLALVLSGAFALTSMASPWASARSHRMDVSAEGRTDGGPARRSIDDSMMHGWMAGGRGWGSGMWSGSGMSGPSYGWDGTGPVKADQARVQAQTWVQRYAPSAVMDAGVQMPMGYRFVVTHDGATVAVVMVDDETGAVWGQLSTAVSR